MGWNPVKKVKKAVKKVTGTVNKATGGLLSSVGGLNLMSLATAGALDILGVTGKPVNPGEAPQEQKAEATPKRKKKPERRT